jgi:hypothetical protein
MFEMFYETRRNNQLAVHDKSIPKTKGKKLHTLITQKGTHLFPITTPLFNTIAAGVACVLCL